MNGSAAAASTLRDSDFGGDVFSNGNALNNQVNAMDNRFISTSVRGYSLANYGSAVGICLPPGQVRFYATGLASGMSSFKSC